MEKTLPTRAVADARFRISIASGLTRLPEFASSRSRNASRTRRASRRSRRVRRADPASNRFSTAQLIRTPGLLNFSSPPSRSRLLMKA